MAYATINDIEARLGRALDETESSTCEALLEEAGVLIDAYEVKADMDARKIVSVRMVVRALESGGTPVGATQGSMSGLGYSQSWTIGSGSAGELYIGKIEKKLLGISNRIGSKSPVEDLVPHKGECLL